MAFVGTLPAADTVAAQSTPTGSISGTVTDAYGNPLPGIWVHASGYDSGGETQTDASGRYEIHELADGDYVVWFNPVDSSYISQNYDGAYDWSDATPVPVVDGQAVSGIDATMEVGGTLTGTVADDDGSSLVGATVCSAGPSYICASTDAEGNYTLTGLAPGDYRVWFETYEFEWRFQYYDGVTSWDEATVVPVDLGEQISGIDAVFAPPVVWPGSISGTVTDAAGSPLAGVFVAASGYEWHGEARTDESGGYVIPGLADGDYVVEFWSEDENHGSPQYYPGGYEWSDATPVSVSDGQAVTGIDMMMQVGSPLSGTVVNYADEPLMGVHVCAESASYRCASTAFDGTYTIAGLAPGDYRVSFEYYNNGWQYQYYDGVDAWEDATLIPVGTGDQVIGIDAVLDVVASDDNTISGTVTDQLGNPLLTAQVCAVGARSSICVDPAEDGTFLLYAEPGENLFGAQGNMDGAPFLSALETLYVGAGQITRDIVVTLEGSIDGVVTDMAGAPAGGARVAVFAPGDSWLPSFFTETATDGSYRLDHLPRQSYRVAFVPPAGSGLATAWHSTEGSVAQVPVTHQGVTTVDHELVSLGAASGVVTDPDGDPVAAAQVSLRAPGSPWVTAATTTGPDGSYSFTGVQPGSYQVRFGAPDGSLLADVWFDDSDHRAQAGVVEVDAGGTTVVDATLRFQRLVTGTVTGPGGVGVEGVVVRAYRPTDGLIPSGRTETAADGSYSLLNLPRGEYRIKVSPPSGSGLSDAWIGGPNRSTARAVVVDDAGQVVVDSELTEN